MSGLSRRAAARVATEVPGTEPICAAREVELGCTPLRGSGWWLLGAVMACTLEPQPIELPVANSGGEESSQQSPENVAPSAIDGQAVPASPLPDPPIDEDLAKDDFGRDSDATSDANRPDAGSGTSPTDAGQGPPDASSQAADPDAG